VIECENCRYCKKFVRVRVTWEDGSTEEFFDSFCIKKFQPVLDSGIILGCSEGELKEEKG